MSEFGGTAVWDAYAEEFPCICVASRNDEGYSLNIYQDKDGAVIGVIIFNEDGISVDAFGYVPAKELINSLR